MIKKKVFGDMWKACFMSVGPHISTFTKRFMEFFVGKKVLFQSALLTFFPTLLTSRDISV